MKHSKLNIARLNAARNQIRHQIIHKTLTTSSFIKSLNIET